MGGHRLAPFRPNHFVSKTCYLLPVLPTPSAHTRWMRPPPKSKRDMIWPQHQLCLGYDSSRGVSKHRHRVKEHHHHRVEEHQNNSSCNEACLFISSCCKQEKNFAIRSASLPNCVKRAKQRQEDKIEPRPFDARDFWAIGTLSPVLVHTGESRAFPAIPFKRTQQNKPTAWWCHSPTDPHYITTDTQAQQHQHSSRAQPLRDTTPGMPTAAAPRGR